MGTRSRQRAAAHSRSFPDPHLFHLHHARALRCADLAVRRRHRARPEFFLQLLGAAQVAFAIWLLAGFAERLAVAIATIGMWVLIVLVAMANPAMLTDPYGALIKDLCLTACAFTVWSLSPLVARQTH